MMTVFRTDEFWDNMLSYPTVFKHKLSRYWLALSLAPHVIVVFYQCTIYIPPVKLEANFEQNDCSFSM